MYNIITELVTKIYNGKKTIQSGPTPSTNASRSSTNASRVQDPIYPFRKETKISPMIFSSLQKPQINKQFLGLPPTELNHSKITMIVNDCFKKYEKEKHDKERNSKNNNTEITPWRDNYLFTNSFTHVTELSPSPSLALRLAPKDILILGSISGSIAISLYLFFVFNKHK